MSSTLTDLVNIDTMIKRDLILKIERIITIIKSKRYLLLTKTHSKVNLILKSTIILITLNHRRRL
jgi:hypothetical protein